MSKVSLSLVLLLWGLVFLLSLWISHGDGYGGELHLNSLGVTVILENCFQYIPIKSTSLFLIMLYWSIRF